MSAVYPFPPFWILSVVGASRGGSHLEAELEKFKAALGLDKARAAEYDGKCTDIATVERLLIGQGFQRIDESERWEPANALKMLAPGVREFDHNLIGEGESRLAVRLDEAEFRQAVQKLDEVARQLLIRWVGIRICHPATLEISETSVNGKTVVAPPEVRGDTPAACGVSPRPWVMDELRRQVFAADGEVVMEIEGGEQDLAHARFVVDAVNRVDGMDLAPVVKFYNAQSMASAAMAHDLVRVVMLADGSLVNDVRNGSLDKRTVLAVFLALRDAAWSLRLGSAELLIPALCEAAEPQTVLDQMSEEVDR